MKRPVVSNDNCRREIINICKYMSGVNGDNETRRGDKLSLRSLRYQMFELGF